MSNGEDRYPFWLKAPLILLGLCLLVVILTYGKFILMPLAFAGIISFLLNPVIRQFESWRLGRVGSILLTLCLVSIALSAMLALVVAQVVRFSGRVPRIIEEMKKAVVEGVRSVEDVTGITEAELNEKIRTGFDNFIETSGEYFASLVGATTGVISLLALLPVFVFFLLYFKEMYQTFFEEALQKTSDSEIVSVIQKIQKIVQSYLLGVMAVIGVLAVLNTLGLLLVGLDHAIFFGVFAAVLAIVPYIGVIVGAIPPVLFAFLLGESLLMPLFVTGVFVAVQFLEGNLISPRIIGSRISINPFMALIALIVGGKIWGIGGMILFVPLVGILRVVFAEVEGLKPYAYVLGNHVEYKS